MMTTVASPPPARTKRAASFGSVFVLLAALVMALLYPLPALAGPTLPVVSSVMPSVAATTSTMPTLSVTFVDPDDFTFTPLFLWAPIPPLGTLGMVPNSQIQYDAGTKTLYWIPQTAAGVPTSYIGRGPFGLWYIFATNETGQGLNNAPGSTFNIDLTSSVAWSNLTPAEGSIITSATFDIALSGRADDAYYSIDPANPFNKLFWDGTPLATTVTNPALPDASVALLSSVSAALDGPHTITAQVRDSVGLDATRSWDVTVAAPPVASAFSPATNSTSRTPLITAHVADNSPGTLSATMKIDTVSVASSFNNGTGTISYQVPGPGLTDAADHTVELTMTDAAGNISTKSWTFHIQTVSDATFTGQTPAPGSTIQMQPESAFVVAHSTTNLVSGSVHLSVDGHAVSPAVTQPDSKTLNISGVMPVLSTGSHEVEVSVTDAVAHTTTSSWTFTIASVPGCTECHVGYPTGHLIPTLTGSVTPPACGGGCHIGSGHYQGPSPADVTGCSPSTCHLGDATHGDEALAGYACSDCHSPAWPGVPRHTDSQVSTSHTSSTTGCDECHSTSLITEHAKYPNPALSSLCMRCHGDTASQTVKDAVTAGSTDCAACHGSAANHFAAHTGVLPAGGGCDECHETDMSAEHEDNCVLCHESTDDRVIAAIADGNAKCGSCHTPGIHAPGFFAFGADYSKWTTTPGPWGRGTPLSGVGDNPTNPGPHANYLATTAKCGMCHSVHRAAGDGTKLLPTDDVTCAGCHTQGTTVTSKIITWATLNDGWVPAFDGGGELTNGSTAGGGGGPHNDSAATLIEDGLWDGTGAIPESNYEPGHRYGCFTRRCHATNPHGANSSKYKLFAAKLLFNNTPEEDDVEEAMAIGTGTYGGDDAVYDDLGATDASVKRFVDNNPGAVQISGSDILIKKTGDSGFRAPDAAETHALVAGLTCGRPSNVPSGEDECHAEASYAVVDKSIKENRNHGTGIVGNNGTGPAPAANGNAYRTDNTGSEWAGFGGNDNRDSKTGHVAGTFAAVPGAASYAAISGCTSCHDQTDLGNTVWGNFTFPHGQTATGATNLYAGSIPNTQAVGIRSRLWAGYAGSVGATLTYTSGTPQKAYDGQCLKCHRASNGLSGIGLTQ